LAFTDPAACGLEPVKFHDSAVTGNGYGDLDANRIARDTVVVEEIGEAEHARRQLADGRTQHALAIVLQLAHVPPHRRVPVLGLISSSRRSPRALAISCARKSPSRSFRCPHIGHNQAQQVAVELAAAGQQDGWNANPS